MVENVLYLDSQEAHNKEPGFVLRYTHQSRNDSPRHGQSWQPELGRRPLQNDIAGKLEQDVAEEIQRQACKIFVAGHMQIIDQAFDTRIGDVASIQETEEVKD